MQLVLLFLGSLLAIFVLLLVLALALPIDVRFRLSRFAEFQASVEARAFAGWGPWIRIAPRKSKPAPRKKAKTGKGKKARKSRRSRSWPDIFEAVKRLVIELFAAISLRDFSIEGEFGTSDPADTGTLYGMMAPFNYAPCRQIRVWPNFDGPCLQGQCTAVLRFTPFALAMPFAKFGWALWGPAK